MPHVGNAIGWTIFLALVNYMVWSVTGLTPMWGLCCQVGKQLGMYVTLVNLGLAAMLVIGGAAYGRGFVFKSALVLVGFNLIPHLAAAMFAFGKSCS